MKAITKTTVKFSQLRDIAFAQRRQPSIIDPLYVQKPKHGGSEIAYRIAALRGTANRLMGPESAFAARREPLMDEYFDKSPEGDLAPKDGQTSINAFEEAMKPLWNITEEIDVMLFPLEEIEAAGYLLSGAEQDALTGLLMEPKTKPALNGHTPEAAA